MLNGKSVWEKEWRKEYGECTRYSLVLHAIEEGPSDSWPPDFQYLEGLLYHNHLLCVPEGLTGYVIRYYHARSGYPGAKRLWPVLLRKFEFAYPTHAKHLNKIIPSMCEVCQVANPPKVPYKCHIEPYLFHPT